ncbi:hypothetical protein BJ684DRAFT_15897 [Piptocephalis cylindrospora]|uniref:N-acetyltransferase domain-containing protein n=1 Tax=Piptocephalis cylindrospora TaxID=1907219 RepID=A0A4P9Y498_9FUNG|nr:hypothetical protein BJ684DRAFT_15897 [Piptocephalis cylindrospora]|eukprot:RKP13735.1 hypothetical protein BJ684DRAFT_15897 [Piptocephalis cylindrospora]
MSPDSHIQENALLEKENFNVRLSTPNDEKHLDTLYNLINMVNQSSASWASEGHIIKVKRIDRESLRNIITKGSSGLFLAFPTPSPCVYPSLGSDEIQRPIACLKTTIEGSKGHISLLAVDPEYQSKGVASSMIHASDKYLISHDVFFSIFMIHHRRNGIKAQYRRLGCQPTGRIEQVSDPDDPIKNVYYIEEWERPLKATSFHFSQGTTRSYAVKSHL